MANYNKSFNFKNGVQVDTDKFVVNTAGLVGIGSTIPTDFLDVKGGATVTGDIKATGLVTSSQLYVSGLSTFFGNIGIGTTNSNTSADPNNTTILNAGIVTANFYYGSGLYMDDVIGFTTEGWNVVYAKGATAAKTGIATELKVGIGTTEANNSYNLIIGSDPSTGNEGITFKASDGNIVSSGTIEASNLTGALLGNVTGEVTSNNNSGISSFSTLKVGNATGFGVTLTAIRSEFDGYIDANNLYAIGIATFAGITTSNDTLFTTQLNASGVSTFNGTITSNDTLFTAQLSASGVSTFNGNVSVADTIFHTENDNTTIRFPDDDNISFETGGTEALRIDENQRIGLGTANPTVDFQLRRDAVNTDATLQVISEKKTATIAVGSSESLQGYTAQFRYGYTGSSYKYSNEISLDTINFSKGNINQVINPLTLPASASVPIGDFNWIVGDSNDPIMALTNSGNLGLGVTNPTDKLEVIGVATVNGAFYATGATYLATSGGITTTGGDLYVDGALEGVNLSLSGNVDVDGEVDTTNLNVTGVGTITNLKNVSSLDILLSVGIGTTADPDYNHTVRIGSTNGDTNPTNQMFVTPAVHVGIRTDQDLTGVGNSIAVNVADSVIIGDRIGIGTRAPRSALDVGIGGSTVTSRFMILPSVTTVERDALVGVTSGALIYNTTTSKMQYRNNSTWVDS